MDNAGPPPTRAGAVAEAFPKFLQHICARDPAPLLLFSELLRCRRVCRDWRHALDDALPTSKHIDFRPFQARVTGGDVRGGTRIDGAAMEAILSRIEQTCARATGIDVQGCGASAVLRAVAVRAQTCFHVDSPADLFAVLSVDG